MILLDTHLLLWAAAQPALLPETARNLLEDGTAEMLFSAASIWEVAIKSGLGRADFQVDAEAFRVGLLAAGYREVPISAQHAAAAGRLPMLHKDPFDRLLIAQAGVERLTLLTVDRVVAQYRGPLLLAA